MIMFAGRRASDIALITLYMPDHISYLMSTHDIVLASSMDYISCVSLVTSDGGMGQLATPAYVGRNFFAPYIHIANSLRSFVIPLSHFPFMLPHLRCPKSLPCSRLRDS